MARTPATVRRTVEPSTATAVCRDCDWTHAGMDAEARAYAHAHHYVGHHITVDRAQRKVFAS